MCTGNLIGLVFCISIFVGAFYAIQMDMYNAQHKKSNNDVYEINHSVDPVSKMSDNTI